VTPDFLQGAVIEADMHLAAAHHRLLVLADLVALGQVRIKVVFTGEDRPFGDLGLDGLAETHREADRLGVEDGQHARQTQVDGAGLAVGGGAKGRGRAGENLGLGGELGVNLQPNDGFPWHGGAALVWRSSPAGQAGVQDWLAR
jgi:hypothetical protein